MKKLNIIIIIALLILLVNFACAEQEISANSMKYVYSKSPDGYPLGSWICFDETEDKVCAPLLKFSIPEIENQNIEFHILLNEETIFSGRACLVNQGEYYTWNEVMENLRSDCAQFNSQNNEINFVLGQQTANEGSLRIVIIPESGSGNIELDSANIIIQGEPEIIPPVEPEEPPIEQTPLGTCTLENIYFSEEEESVNLPVELFIDTNNCNDSLIKIKIIKKSLTGNNVVSEKQSLVSQNKLTILWVAEETGNYYATAESDNIILSGTLIIKEYSSEELLKDKNFNEVINEIYKIAKVDKNTARRICDEMPTSIQTDICIENLAIYVKDKLLCSRIDDKNRKESCYMSFALQGDVSGCIHTNSKLSCIMLGILTRNSNLTLTPEDQYKDAVVMQKKRLNPTSVGIIALIIIAIILFVLIEFLLYKKKKKRSINSKNLLAPKNRTKK